MAKILEILKFPQQNHAHLRLSINQTHSGVFMNNISRSNPCKRLKQFNISTTSFKSNLSNIKTEGTRDMDAISFSSCYLKFIQGLQRWSIAATSKVWTFLCQSETYDQMDVKLELEPGPDYLSLAQD